MADRLGTPVTRISIRKLRNSDFNPKRDGVLCTYYMGNYLATLDSYTDWNPCYWNAL